jgi:hypothetical protein
VKGLDNFLLIEEGGMSRKGNGAIVLERCQPTRGTSTSRNHRCPARKRERSPDFPQKASASNYQNHSRGAVISIVHPGWCPVTVLSDLLPDAYASQAACARPPHLRTGFAPFTIVARSGCASRSDASEPSSGYCLSSSAPSPALAPFFATQPIPAKPGTRSFSH